MFFIRNVPPASTRTSILRPLGSSVGEAFKASKDGAY